MPEPRPDLHDDDRLVELLSEVVDDDFVADDLVSFAAGALTWRTVGAELAELLYDSARDEAVTVRDVDLAARLLSFGDAARGVELEVETGRIVGVIRPEAAYAIEVEGPGGSATATSDGGGMFELAHAIGGMARIVVSGLGDSGSAGPVLVTAWFDLP